MAVGEDDGRLSCHRLRRELVVDERAQLLDAECGAPGRARDRQSARQVADNRLWATTPGRATTFSGGLARGQSPMCHREQFDQGGLAFGVRRQVAG
jgi:hypothetical protein